MDEAALHELLSGRRRTVGAAALRNMLSLASWTYSAAMTARNAAYDHRIFRVETVVTPVISLGNITTGGTGKTPMAAWLANWLLAEGCRPGLLSRGYRTLAAEGDGQAAGNDEKRVLDRLCPGVPHLQQRDRVQSARRLIEESDRDVLILDDGFQHRRLHRDLDLLLIDALQPWGFGHVLPRGLLREPKSGIRRADLILITRASQSSTADRRELKNEIARYRGGSDDCVEIAFAPQYLIGLDGTIQPLSLFSDQKAFAFCGIGNPDGFRRTLASFGMKAELTVYPDHHHYQPTEIVGLASAASAASCTVSLTTLKDLVKIPPDSWKGPPLFAVDIGVKILTGEELLINRLRRIVDSVRSAKNGILSRDTRKEVP